MALRGVTQLFYMHPFVNCFSLVRSRPKWLFCVLRRSMHMNFSLVNQIKNGFYYRMRSILTIFGSFVVFTYISSAGGRIR